MLAFCAVGFVPDEIFATGRTLVNMQKVRSKKRDVIPRNAFCRAFCREAAFLPEPSSRAARFRDHSRSRLQSAKA